MNLTV